MAVVRLTGQASRCVTVSGEGDTAGEADLVIARNAEGGGGLLDLGREVGSDRGGCGELEEAATVEWHGA